MEKSKEQLDHEQRTLETRERIKLVIDRFLNKPVTPKLVRELKKAVEWKLIEIVKSRGIDRFRFEEHIKFSVEIRKCEDSELRIKEALEVKPANLFTTLAFNSLEIDRCPFLAKEWYSPLAQGVFIWHNNTQDAEFRPVKNG